MAERLPPPSAVSLQSLLRALRRRLWLLALCALLVPVAVVSYSLAQQKQYRATASLLLRGLQPAALFDAGATSQASQDDERQANTTLTLAGLRVVAERTARRLDVRADDVADRVDLEPVAATDVTKVNVTDPDPVVAARVANAYGEEFIRLQRNAALADIRRAQTTVRARLRSIDRRLAALQRERGRGRAQRSLRAAERRALRAERDDLLERQGDLRSLASATTGNVELVERAVPPTDPISPNPKRDAVIGLGLGLILGVALVLLFEMLDRRVRDPGEVGELVDLPVLGAIPNSRALAEPPALGGLPATERRAFHMLRTSLRYYSHNRHLRSVLVTSAGQREGKTTVAWNLAAVGAQAGESVLMLEADLRHPSLAARYHVDADRGLGEVLRGEASLLEVVTQVVVSTGLNGSTAPSVVDVVVAGSVRGDVTNLIESQRMAAVVREARERYGLVVIDTPPTSVVPDAIPLMSAVDGVLVVTRLGRTTRDAVNFVSTQLAHVRAPALGTVVNGVTRQDAYYGGDTRGRDGYAAEPELAGRA